MKKATILITALIAAQALYMHAWSLFNSSSEENVSSTSSVSSAEGGTVNLNGKTYDLEPGQTLEISSGKSSSSHTTQESGKEPVTTTVIDEQEPTVLINGKPANDASESLVADTENSQLINSTAPEESTATLENISAEEAANIFNDAELDAAIEAYLDFGDSYEE